MGLLKKIFITQLIFILLTSMAHSNCLELYTYLRDFVDPNGTVFEVPLTREIEETRVYSRRVLPPRSLLPDRQAQLLDHRGGLHPIDIFAQIKLELMSSTLEQIDGKLFINFLRRLKAQSGYNLSILKLTNNNLLLCLGADYFLLETAARQSRVKVTQLNEVEVVALIEKAGSGKFFRKKLSCLSMELSDLSSSRIRGFLFNTATLGSSVEIDLQSFRPQRRGKYTRFVGVYNEARRERFRSMLEKLLGPTALATAGLIFFFLIKAYQHSKNN